MEEDEIFICFVYDSDDDGDGGPPLEIRERLSPFSFPGRLFFSGKVNQHGPRVKYYDHPVRVDDPSVFDWGHPPKLLIPSKGKLTSKREATIIAWIDSKRDLLQEYWDRATSMSSQEKELLIERLRL